MPVTRLQQKENDSADQQHQEVVPESASVASSTASFHGFAEWETAMDDATRKEFEKAVRQRAQVKMKLVRISRTLASNQEIGLAQLSVLSKKLSATDAEFSQIHTQIVGLVPDKAIEEQEKEYGDYEDMYYAASNVVEALILAAKTASSSATPVSSAAPQVIIQQQPLKAPIPTFDGTYAAWPKFKAIFQDLMDNSGDSDAIKLYHLDKALIGEAAGALDTKVLSDGDYDYAWDILTDRFENQRVIVETHIRGLLSLRKMTSETHKELRALLNEATRHVESLRYALFRLRSYNMIQAT
ncbi:hypothetical protein RP20_CCG004967 [Aedes albopictus]|nr:hypothetical protein RP20_CCG004967 [Aedes albopictus]